MHRCDRSKRANKLTKDLYIVYLVEKSIGKEKTNELAVMIDPFRPLMITEEALLIEDENYHKSWQHNIE